MREKVEIVVRWVSMIMGALILGSCTLAGGSIFENASILKYPIGGALGMLLGFLLGALIVGVLFGWIYAYFLLRRDLKIISVEIAKLSARSPPS
jgi:ABC-type antimicrobial peptide transport system permease subunit